MFAFLALITVQVSLVQSFYGSRSTVKFAASSSFQRSPSTSRISDVVRSSGLNHRSRRIFSASTEAADNSVDTVKAIVVNVPQVIIVDATLTPAATPESCNWPTPVPYAQLTVGVPKEKLDGEICWTERYATPT